MMWVCEDCEETWADDERIDDWVRTYREGHDKLTIRFFHCEPFGTSMYRLHQQRVRTVSLHPDSCCCTHCFKRLVKEIRAQHVVE